MPALAGAACLGLGPGLVSLYGFFVEPLSREFGVGAAVLNMGPVALLLVPGVVAPFIGRLADRLPIRRLILLGALLAMGGLIAASQSPTLLLAGLCFLLFSFGLTLYGPVVVNGLMVKLYPGREARALAIAAIGISIATALLPPLLGQLLAALDWRAALATLAGGVLLALWLLVLWGVPAGVVGSAAETGDAVAVDRASPRGRVETGIYRRPAFWLIGFCVALALNAVLVLAIAYPPHFATEGYTVAQAGGFLSLTGIAGLIGKTVIAWLGDAGRARAQWLAAGILAVQALGIGLLVAASGLPMVLVAMSLIGFGAGAFLPMQTYLNSCHFDAAVIGEVTGAQMPLFLPFALVSAPLAGYVFDRVGNYHGVFVALVVAALLALRLPPPTR